VLKATWRPFAGIVIPYGLQQVLFAAGFAVTLWVIGLTGTVNLAIAGLIFNISIFFFLPAVGFGIAAAGQVSFCMGAKQYREVKLWTNMTIVLVFILFGLMSLPVIIFNSEIMAMFFTNGQVAEMAATPLQIAALVFALEGISLLLMQVLFALNNGIKAVSHTFILQWLVFLPMFYVWVSNYQPALVAMWIAIVVFRVSNLLLLFGLWRVVQKIPQFSIQTQSP
jgi:Na+-driven multidrug efflux pump